MLSHQEARRFYDRIGSLQDSQAFYEDRAVRVLLRHADFASAQAVFEFGCGTGRFARRLLDGRLPPTARYLGVDVSPVMVELARERLAPFGSYAEVVLTDGGPPADEPADSCDRFVSCYVLDLLAEPEIRGVLQEARRMLRPGGLLCLVSLSTGVGPLSRAVSQTLSWLHSLRPALVGGCRPLDLLPFIDSADWKVRHHAKVVAFGITSEAVLAEPR